MLAVRALHRLLMSATGCNVPSQPLPVAGRDSGFLLRAERRLLEERPPDPAARVEERVAAGPRPVGVRVVGRVHHAVCPHHFHRPPK